jgi:hypothetical protein
MASQPQKDEIRQWLESWYACGDKRVPSNSINFFASDCEVRFNNGEPARGKEAAQKVRQMSNI